MKPLVYVSAPYTDDPVGNTRRAIEAAAYLLDGGWVTPLVPHLSLMWDLVAPRPYRSWIAYDLALVAKCDAVYRLPGASRGADAEVAEARRLSVPVFTTTDTLYGWAAGGPVETPSLFEGAS